MTMLVQLLRWEETHRVSGDDGTYTVSIVKNATVTPTVTMIACTCPDFRPTSGPCQHIRGVCGQLLDAGLGTRIGQPGPVEPTMVDARHLLASET